MKLSRKKLTWLVILLVICGAGAGLWFGVIRPKLAAKKAEAARQAQDAEDMDRTYKVRRDDLVIGLLQGGYVNASQKHKLSLQANYRTKLLWVIDENTKVKAGDLLARFETDELKEQIENLESYIFKISVSICLSKHCPYLVIETFHGGIGHVPEAPESQNSIPML